jgi:hypothetical protein
MSGDGSVTLQWGDGEYRFRLGIGEWRELQEKCNAGPPVLFRRLHNQEWMIDDIVHSLRLGLIGGGMDATRALAKVSKHITPGNITAHALPALLVVGSSIDGNVADQVGKAQAAAAAAMEALTTMGKSDGQTTSETPRPSDGQSNNSTGQAFGNSRPQSMAGTDATAAMPMNGRQQ